MNLTRKVKIEGTSLYYSSSVASLKDKLLPCCHRPEYTASSRKFSICHRHDCYRLWFCTNSTFLWWVDKTAGISIDWEESFLPWSPSHWTGTKTQNLAEKHLEKIILSRERKPCLFQLQAEIDSLAKSPGQAIKGWFSSSWTLHGGNIMWYTLKVRKLQIFEDICYRLQTLYFYILK